MTSPKLKDLPELAFLNLFSTMEAESEQAKCVYWIDASTLFLIIDDIFSCSDYGVVERSTIAYVHG
ncbi:hypothetical protein NECAME_07719 [Necator americanus]|uniref:Uncharacterized protein n=1 Tax=Necator americanus TaxID=51031 RepID=W2TM68_NECAM|nr:hypothetical protein NECAME_07719 [Necator americanus]ETN82833.1 hypothetical protein NECAME_07719 [Necator americanus]